MNLKPKQPEKLIFVSIMFPRKSSEINIRLLVESIRTFGGSLAQNPIWILIPNDTSPHSPTIRKKLETLNVSYIPFNLDSNLTQFFFAGKISALAFAESLALKETELLVWLDSNTLVLREPTAFLLSKSQILAYRPVHHTLIGSRYNEPLDPFWTQIYKSCNVVSNRIFPMMTHIDATRIRPYFNAGLLVTRPTTQLFRTWSETFFKVYQTPGYQTFYEQDQRYHIFMHQAILSGVILSMLPKEKLQELPPDYNYPLHLHSEDITRHRPTNLEELSTIRHEGFYNDPNWIEIMPASKQFKRWIAQRL